MKIVDLRMTVVGTPWRELTFVELMTDEGLTGVGEVRMVNKTERSSPACRSWRRAMSSAQIRSTSSGSRGTCSVPSTDGPARSRSRCSRRSTSPAGTSWGRRSACRCGSCSAAVPRSRAGVRERLVSGRAGPAAIAKLAGTSSRSGYRALKIDPFGAAPPDAPPERRRAIEIVAAVREAVGPDVQILIEMHGRFTPATAARGGAAGAVRSRVDRGARAARKRKRARARPSRDDVADRDR